MLNLRLRATLAAKAISFNGKLVNFMLTEKGNSLKIGSIEIKHDSKDSSGEFNFEAHPSDHGHSDISLMGSSSAKVVVTELHLEQSDGGLMCFEHLEFESVSDAMEMFMSLVAPELSADERAIKLARDKQRAESQPSSRGFTMV